MEARMKNPAYVLPDTMKGIQTIYKAIYQGGVPQELLEIIALRASQINGCSACVHAHVQNLKKSGESDERVFAVAAWREAPYFTDAERAALALAEAATRLSDRTDPVPDEVFEEAARHYDEPTLSALIIEIALINFWNRLTVTVRQPAGSYPG